ncbi:MAG: hypothetical protein RBU29_08890, partial [bacterium]|nr:hypothetical protein [bacterium]
PLAREAYDLHLFGVFQLFLGYLGPASDHECVLIPNDLDQIRWSHLGFVIHLHVRVAHQDIQSLLSQRITH